MARYWRCQRVTAGQKCGTLNMGTRKKCTACQKLRPQVRKAAHRAVLSEMPYEAWVAIYGERCGVCGCGPTAKRRLDRDHDHATGRPRGLLCHRHNRLLASWVTADVLRAAADYLDRAATREDLAA